MSLTSHIESRRSPVRAWLEQNFPETRNMAREANRTLRGGGRGCAVPRVDGADASLVGTAVDYLLRACMRVDSIDRTVASVAAELLASDPAIGARSTAVEREAVARIKALDPGRRDLADREWTELCSTCLALARLEQFYRAGPMNPTILDLLVLPLRRCGDLASFTSLSLSTPSVEDLERLGRVAWEDNRTIRDVRPLILNPKFRLSRDLGGADADLIAEGRLIEWKATTTAGIVGRPQLWQLVGYLLADAVDEYAIREVSISALRWRSTVTWPVERLLAELAPGPPAGLTTLKGERFGTPVDIDSLRADFAGVVRRASQRAPAGLPPVD